MRKGNFLKLGFGVLIMAVTLLAPNVARAGFCVSEYKLANGHVCTLSAYTNGCCEYTGDPQCHPICLG
jgi:hypothetical protein